MDQIAYFVEICFAMILSLLLMMYSNAIVSSTTKINPTIAPITMPANAPPGRPSLSSEFSLSLVVCSPPVCDRLQYNYA